MADGPDPQLLRRAERHSALPRPVLVLPGWTNSDPGHWQSIWEARHPDFRRVMQADWDNPDRDDWVATLDAAVRAAGAPPVLVAHSLGCITVAHWAGRRRYASAAAAALLVAPADVGPDAPAPVRGFAPIPLNPLPFPSIVVASRTDPYLDFERAAAMAAGWGAELVDVGDAGHVNVAAGFGPWPAGEALLARLSAGAA